MLVIVHDKLLSETPKCIKLRNKLLFEPRGLGLGMGLGRIEPYGLDCAKRSMKGPKKRMFFHVVSANETLYRFSICVYLRADKKIKDAVKKIYDIQAKKVNTLIRSDGIKKAYVRLTRDDNALDVANKIRII
ncbi:hypothetical protein VNO78_16404 [Psophocarpus tetragonolobus]|uniref:50S ribosomal protein L23, chloroplastic n=1 Tax=Psophocarpus tetragonolobus TaxID=3891 RepID=A0AAN9XKR7_PSOTE